MYSVSQKTTEQYGNVIEIAREEVSQFETPFQAFNKSLTLRRLWVNAGKIRLLVIGQIMTAKQAESWAINEYKSLPKCEGCAKILNGNLYSHSLSSGHTFCSQACADKDFLFKMEKLNDEEEIEYL
jgi:hypothetical protein